MKVTTPRHDLGVVHPRVLDVNRDFSLTWAWGGHFAHLENLRAARLRDYYSAHRCSLL